MSKELRYETSQALLPIAAMPSGGARDLTTEDAEEFIEDVARLIDGRPGDPGKLYPLKERLEAVLRATK